MVSIILPVYNVEKYVLSCLDSIANQTYTDIEVIIVDDCGQDQSMHIVKQFVDSYKGPIQFFITHQDKNRGLSAARNMGMSCAQGDYLFFLDSDDMISSNCIEVLYESITQRSDIQMSIGDVSIIGKDADWGMLHMPPGIYDKGAIYYYLHHRYYIPVWNKLVKKSFITDNSLLFEEGLIHEDYLWSFQVACKMTCFSVVDKKTYKYLRREDSLDNNSDRWKHNINYSRACSLQPRAALKTPGGWYRKILFEYVENKRVSLFVEADKNGRVDICHQHYLMIRNEPQWNPLVLLIRRCSLGSILRTFHKLLPRELGFKYYMMIIRKFNE